MFTHSCRLWAAAALALCERGEAGNSRHAMRRNVIKSHAPARPSVSELAINSSYGSQWHNISRTRSRQRLDACEARGNHRAVADKSNYKQSIDREDLMTRIVRRGAGEKVRAVNTTPVSGACVVHVRRRPEGMRLAARGERGQITISQSRLNGTKAFRNEALFSYLTVQ